MAATDGTRTVGRLTPHSPSLLCPQKSRRLQQPMPPKSSRLATPRQRATPARGGTTLEATSRNRGGGLVSAAMSRGGPASSSAVAAAAPVPLATPWSAPSGDPSPTSPLCSIWDFSRHELISGAHTLSTSVAPLFLLNITDVAACLSAKRAAHVAIASTSSQDSVAAHGARRLLKLLVTDSLLEAPDANADDDASSTSGKGRLFLTAIEHEPVPALSQLARPDIATALALHSTIRVIGGVILLTPMCVSVVTEIGGGFGPRNAAMVKEVNRAMALERWLTFERLAGSPRGQCHQRDHATIVSEPSAASHGAGLESAASPLQMEPPHHSGGLDVAFLQGPTRPTGLSETAGSANVTKFQPSAKVRLVGQTGPVIGAAATATERPLPREAERQSDLTEGGSASSAMAAPQLPAPPSTSQIPASPPDVSGVVGVVYGHVSGVVAPLTWAAGRYRLVVELDDGDAAVPVDLGGRWLEETIGISAEAFIARRSEHRRSASCLAAAAAKGGLGTAPPPVGLPGDLRQRLDRVEASLAQLGTCYFSLKPCERVVGNVRFEVCRISVTPPTVARDDGTEDDAVGDERGALQNTVDGGVDLLPLCIVKEESEGPEGVRSGGHHAQPPSGGAMGSLGSTHPSLSGSRNHDGVSTHHDDPQTTASPHPSSFASCRSVAESSGQSRFLDSLSLSCVGPGTARPSTTMGRRRPRHDDEEEDFRGDALRGEDDHDEVPGGEPFYDPSSVLEDRDPSGAHARSVLIVDDDSDG